MLSYHFSGVKSEFMVKDATEWPVILSDLLLEAGKDNEK